MNYRAFVSSTYVDLKDHRSYVIETLRKSGFTVDSMEDWTADSDEPKQFSQERVVGCDLCVVLVAFRRGYVPQGETKSITQMEYEKALSEGIGVLPFLLKEDALWQRQFDELDKDSEVCRWREELSSNYGVGFFDHNPQSIRISEALNRWQPKQTVRLEPWTRPRAGVPFQAPPLPSYYVARPYQKQAIKTVLLRDEVRSGTLVMSAIHGLGGIGKSTLAAALAWDPEVGAFFSDGILWATLGQQPDVLSLLSGWIQALGDRDFKPTTTEVASSHLRTLLRGTRMLLVVDDAWNAEHVRPFLVGSEWARVLVTTREVQVAGAEYVQLEELTREQSLDLLSKSAGAKVAGDKNLSDELAEMLGDLPLALELASAQLGQGVLIADLLNDLTRERLTYLDSLEAASTNDEATLKHYSLKASFNLSLKRLSVELLHQFAWMGVLPEDVPITAKMASTLWEMEVSRADRILRVLRTKALLLPGAKGTDGRQSYRLHDLMHEAAQSLLLTDGTADGKSSLPGLGLTVEEAHAQFLERYRLLVPEGQWCQLLNDGYIG